jgi:hypothetical protein
VCRQANYAYDLIEDWLERLADIDDDLLSAAAAALAIWALAPAAILALIGIDVLAIAAQLMAWRVYSEAIDQLTEYALLWWRENKEELICDLYNSIDARISQSAVWSKLFLGLVAFGELQPWWFSSMNSIIDASGFVWLPVRLFIAPFRALAPNGYEGGIDCDNCGPQPVPGEDFWQWVAGLGVHGALSVYANYEVAFSFSGEVAGNGAGNSYQGWNAQLIEYADINPDDQTHVAVSGSVELIMNAVAAGSAQSGRRLYHGLVNQRVLLSETLTDAGEVVSEHIYLSFWIGMDGETLPGTHDIEVLVNDRRKLHPNFIWTGTGYGIRDTEWQLIVDGYTLHEAV